MSTSSAVAIDVLLPVFTLAERPLLARSIGSIFAQELPAKTLWVLINGGLKHERQQLATFVQALAPTGHPTELEVVCLDQPGIATALNRGLSLSQAEWLARLDADDSMNPQRLRLMVEYLQRCSQAGVNVPDVIGSAVAVMNASGESPSGRVMRRPCRNWAIRGYLYIGNPFLHPSVMMRRMLLQQVGGYRPCRGTEDLDLWLRLSRISYVTFANLPEPLTLYSIRPGSLSHQRDSFLHSASCRLNHCDTPLHLLLHGPKVLSDLLHYLAVLLMR